MEFTIRHRSRDSSLRLTSTSHWNPTIACVCRRLGPSWNSSDGQGRRTTITLTEERIQGPRTMLQQLLRQEKRPTLRGNPDRTRKTIVQSVAMPLRACSTMCQPYECYNADEHDDYDSQDHIDS